jgi:predicted anti-sigma-YlaC factor YlaD
VKRSIPILLLATLLATGCSFRHFAVNQVGNAFSGSGVVFANDDDPELVRQAVPFGLKLQESLLAESPRHAGLLLSTASGFTQYTYAFVQEDADELASKDIAASNVLKDRARKLYLRARNYALRGLEIRHPGFDKALRQNPQKTVRGANRSDVPLLYWSAAAWGSMIALSKNNPELVADQPQVEALIDRALKLDEKFEHGAIHTFLITYEMARRGGSGSPADRARQHFERAVELSDGKVAAPFVAYAEQVCVTKQNRKEFEAMLNKALAIDVDAKPDSRLENLVMQRRAKWLLGRIDDLILE